MASSMMSSDNKSLRPAEYFEDDYDGNVTDSGSNIAHELRDAMRQVITKTTGADLESAHLQETPQRFLNMLVELTTPPEIKWKTFPAPSDEMIVETNIRFVSLCAHHLVPYMGVCHIAYVPKLAIVGLSKLPRVVNHFAAALTVQEELTGNIAGFLVQQLEPLGVGVIMQAEHLCMAIRGVKSPGVTTHTSAMKGVFNDHTRTAKAEFLHFVNGSK